jgi:hypothetical protein
MIVMAVDPGKTTGFALLDLEKGADIPRLAYSAELDFEGFSRAAE